jgi:hypothetical protein
MNLGEAQPVGIDDALANETLGFARASARASLVEQPASSGQELPKLLPGARRA